MQSVSLNKQEIAFLKSLKDSELLTVLEQYPEAEQRAIVRAIGGKGKVNERSANIKRLRSRRSLAAEVEIHECMNPPRRERCLADPELFLMTYGAPDAGNPNQPGRFWMPFANHHKQMIAALWERAITGGDKSIAAPRGDGKTTTVAWMLIFIILAGLRRHPIAIGATNKLAKDKLFDPIKQELARNQLLWEDFPEVCGPIRELDGAPQRASKQHIDGVKTHIKWTQDHIVFPHVVGSPYGGCTLAFYGMDVAIRGGRADFAVIDDPETEQVAANIEANFKIEKTIDGAVAGMAFPNRTVPRVVITTIQNRHCYSYRVTSRDLKEGGRPSFEGDRYGLLAEWPTNRDLWDEYIVIRQQAQSEGDKDGWAAVDFYKANRDEMEAGSVVSNPLRFDRDNPAEITALQAFFNRVADWGLSRVMAELQNDPDPEEFDETLGLTPGLVQRRISGLQRRCIPEGTDKITLGLDIGKYRSHWVKVAWHGNAVGCIIDYGVMETYGMQADTSVKAVEIAILSSMLQWRGEQLSENTPDFVLVDSGDYSDAVYEFVRQTGLPFQASKGYATSKFRLPLKSEEDKRPFIDCYASRLPDQKQFLYNVDTEAWKHWVQQRFITNTFTDQHQFADGSLSLFASDDPKIHLSFSHHMCSEERQERFVEGKGLVRKWVTISKNNHWLDALALACAGAGVVGVRLVQRVSLESQIQQSQGKRQRQHKPKGDRYRTRPGGWVQGSRQKPLYPRWPKR